MDVLRIITMLAGAVILLGPGIAFCQVQSNDTVKTVSRVDLGKYIGTWYEIARLPNSFQKQCAGGTTATYSLRDDGKIDVVNRCVEQEGRVSEARGIARVVDTSTCARLEVSFVRFLGIQLFWGDYWVIGLDSNYRFAVVGTPSHKYAWILSRTPAMLPDDLKSALETLKSQGFDTGKLLYTAQGPR